MHVISNNYTKYALIGFCPKVMKTNTFLLLLRHNKYSVYGNQQT